MLVLESTKMYNVDVDALYDRIFQSKWRRKALLVQELGKVKQYPLLLLRPEHLDPRLPNLLFTGCFHGNEPSGSFGIVSFLEKGSINLTKLANCSFLPIVNPTGLASDLRRNYKKQDPNRGFFGHKKLSIEGKILVKNKLLLTELGKDLVVSFHEHSGTTPGGFLFSCKDNGKFVKNICNTIKKSQGLVSAKELKLTILEYHNFGNFFAKNGRVIGRVKKKISEEFDSFDDYMLLKSKCRETATIELPNKFNKNVSTIRAIIENLCRG